MLKILLAVGAACVVLAVTVVAGAAPPLNTSPPTINDTTPAVGQTLTGSDGSWDVDPAPDSTTREWVRCDPDCASGPVVGSGATYQVQSGDANKTLVFRVTMTNVDGGPVSADSAPTSVVVGPLDKVVLSPGSASIPTTGSQAYTAEGFDAFNNSLGNITGSTTFSIGPDGSCTGATCTATSLGAHTVTGTSGGKSGTASLTVTVGPLHHLVLSPASPSVQAGVAQAFTAQGFDVSNNSLGDVTASTTFSITPNGTCTGASCTATVVGSHTVTGTNAGKTGTASMTVTVGPLDHLTLTPATASVQAGTRQAYTAEGLDAYNNSRGDVTATTTFSIAPDGDCTAAGCTGQTVGAHTVTGTSAGKTGTASLTVTGVAPVNTVAPALSQPTPTFTIGATTNINVSTGTWTAVPALTPASYTYQWQRCASADPASCVAIAGATAAAYALQQADVGSFLRAAVTAANTVPPPGVAYAITQAAVRQSPPYQGTTDAATPPPSIVDPNNDGKPSVGETLQGLAGTWFASPAPTLTPRWFRCNPLGQSCVAVNPQPSFTPGVATGPEPFRHTNPGGSWPYAVTDADLGSTLKLVARATNSTPVVNVDRESVVTAVVQSPPVNLAAVPNGLPALTGTAARAPGSVPNALTATSGLWTGFSSAGAKPLTITHLWQRCPATGSLDNCVPVNADPPLGVGLSPSNALTCTSVAPCGGTSQYPLSDADLGSRIRAVVTVSNSLGSVTLTTPPSAVVVGAPMLSHLGNGDPDPAAKPKVTGTAQTGYTLVASTGSWSAYPSDSLVYALQWLRCSSADSCSPVSGATADTYLLSQGDVGSLMRVRVTATNGVDPPGVEMSDPTAKVAGGGGTGGGADLAALLSASTAGSQVTYTVRVRNVGSADADGVVLTATLPAEVTVLSSATAKGSCSGRVTCAIGQVKVGETVAVTIVVTASQTGTYSFSATVSSSTPDADPSNNTASTGSRLSAVGARPSSEGGTGSTAGGGQGGTGGKATVQLVVPLKNVSLRARRVGSSWVASTAFTIYSGKATLQMSVTKNGSMTPLKLLGGSRLGPTVGKAGATQLKFTAPKSATFPIKVVLPAKGFSPRAVYVIRITATAAGGSSSLNIGFKGAALITRATVARTVGKTWITGSTLKLPTGKGTALRAWVTPLGSAKKLPLLKGSSLGRTMATTTRATLGTTAAKPGNLPVRVLLSTKGLSAKKVYVLHAEAKSPDGLWTDYEIRFKGKGAARALTGTRTTR